MKKLALVLALSCITTSVLAADFKAVKNDIYLAKAKPCQENCIPPGHAKTPPGWSKTPPGLNKMPPGQAKKQTRSFWGKVWRTILFWKD